MQTVKERNITSNLYSAVLSEALPDSKSVLSDNRATSLARKEEDYPKHWNTPNRKAEAKREKRN